MLNAVLVDGYCTDTVRTRICNILKLEETEGTKLKSIGYCQEGGFVQHLVVYDPLNQLDEPEEEYRYDAYKLVCRQDYFDVSDTFDIPGWEYQYTVNITIPIGELEVSVLYQICGTEDNSDEYYQM